MSPTGRGSLAFLGLVEEGVSPRLCLFDARADHLCFDALKVVLRSFRGVKVLDESGVVVLRLGVTLGAIVTLGRVEERRVDAWDWALALSGIICFVRRCAVLGVQRAFEPGGCVTPFRGQTGSAVGSIGLVTSYNSPGLPTA